MRHFSQDKKTKKTEKPRYVQEKEHTVGFTQGPGNVALLEVKHIQISLLSAISYFIWARLDCEQECNISTRSNLTKSAHIIFQKYWTLLQFCSLILSFYFDILFAPLYLN